MPKYIYHCKKCNIETNITCPMKDYSSTVPCDSCGELVERKVEDILPQNYICNTTGFYGKQS